MDILNRDFKRATIRGYKEDEVDEFLDRLASDFDRVLKENDRLKEQLNSNEKEIAQFRQMEKNLKDTIVVAQNTAEEVMNAAKKNAEELKNNTQHECQNMRELAQIDARRQIEDASMKLRDIAAEYDKIVREKSAFLLKIRTALEAELAITTQVLNSVPQNISEKVSSQPIQPTPPPPEPKSEENIPAKPVQESPKAVSKTSVSDDTIQVTKKPEMTKNIHQNVIKPRIIR